MGKVSRVLKHPVFKNKKLILFIFAVAAIIIAVQRTFFIEANNFRIFYYSLQHLQKGVSLYSLYPAEYQDHFLYAPAFAVIFSPFFSLPYTAALFLWFLFFAFVWVYGVHKFPVHEHKKVFIYWFGLQELLTALSNAQTNPLIAVIPLFAFAAFEKRKPFWAAFFILLGFNIKIYSLVAAALFLMYPKKINFFISSIFWGLFFAILPLLYTSPAKLVWQYGQWLGQLLAKTNNDKEHNVSIHRILTQLFGVDFAAMYVIGMGVLIFCSVFIYRKMLQTPVFKFQMLASILIFQVIFNPAAESASYITAVTGVSIWWLYSPKKVVDKILVIACYFLTVLSATDLFPPLLKELLIKPYVLKAWPCVLIWFRIIYLMHQAGLAENKLYSSNHLTAPENGK